MLTSLTSWQVKRNDLIIDSADYEIVSYHIVKTSLE